MSDQFLDGAYELESAEQTKALYKRWAETYDDELEANGYASPQRTAFAMRACGANLDQAILDIGCGSGVSGFFLSEFGFKRIHGSDFSPEMLAQAEQKNIYQSLHLADFADPFDYIQEPFYAYTAVGVFSVGHAQADTLTDIIDLMPKSGLFGFSLNDHTLEDSSYLEAIHRYVFDRRVRIRWQEYGEHLPGINLKSMIIVLEKTKA